MKTSIRTLAALWSIAACVVAFGQTTFPQPNQNIYIDASHILVGSLPVSVVGTNAPGTAGYALFSDGLNLYWGQAATSGGTVTNLTINNFNVNVISNYQAITFNTNVVINNNLNVNNTIVTSNLYTTNIITTNLFANNVYTTNLYSTNVTIYDSLTVNTNVTINQNISVSGKATLNTIIVTNTTLFSTNAYPLSPGTTWDLSRRDQEVITNANFNITALSGLTNYLDNAGTLWVSNSGASSITVGFTVAGAIAIGPNTTNSLIVPSTKMAVYTVDAWGNKRVCYVCQLGQ